MLESLSRLMPYLVDGEHQTAAAAIRRNLSAWQDGRDLVQIGAYKQGTNAALDEALLRLPAIEAFLRQGPGELTTLSETREMLQLLSQPVGAF